MCIMYILCITCITMQDGFCPREVEFRSLQTMSKAMMVNVISLHEGTFLLLFCPVLQAELAAWLTAHLQNWTATRIWNCTGLILWMQWTALLPGQCSRARFTCSMRDRNQSRGQLEGHLAMPILAWYFKRAQALDLNSASVPLLHLFYADKSFSGSYGTKYPAYGT